MHQLQEVLPEPEVQSQARLTVPSNVRRLRQVKTRSKSPGSSRHWRRLQRQRSCPVRQYEAFLRPNKVRESPQAEMQQDLWFLHFRRIRANFCSRGCFQR